jgi:hypothetical protein
MTEAALLVSHLKYCRQRASAAGILGLAALLAWRALPGVEGQKELLQQAYAAEQSLVLQKQRWAKIRGDLTRWVATVPREQIERTSSAVSTAGSALERLDISATGATFFTTSPRIDHELQAVAGLSEHPLPSDLAAWSRGQFDDVATLLGARSTTPSTTEIADLRAARAALEGARADSRGIAIAEQGIEALNAFDSAVSELDRTPPPVDLTLAGQAKHIVDLMGTLGMTDVGALELAGEARSATQSLRDGSLSVLGFTVPGLVVRVLVPILALGITIDLLIGALRARAFARRAVAATDVSLILAGFPWRVTPTDALAWPRRLRTLFGVLAPVPLVLSLAAIVPLTLAGDTRTAVVGLTLLALAACAAVAAVRVVAHATGGSPTLLSAGEGADLRLDLAKEQLDSVNSTVSLLLLACVTTLSFFLAFMLVPRALLLQGNRIASLLETRNGFDRAYTQRLRDQGKTYSDWCDEAGCTPWANFGFAANAVPEGHPAAPLLKTLWEQPIVRAEMSATDSVKDLVTESHALLPDLDQDDVGHVREILYRDSFAPVVSLLGELQRINAETPLPREVLEHLPDGVKQPPSAGMTVPFTFPYRTMVERGGFADRLAALPREDQVQAWLDFMKANGLDRVRGFDVLAGALADLNAEIGKTKLKIAGVEVQRAVAGDAALIVLALITFGLATRLRDARAYICSLRPQEATLAIQRAPGIILMHDPRLGGRMEGLLALGCCALPAVTAWIVLRAPTDSPTPYIVGWLLLVLTFAAVVVLTIERQRLVAVMNQTTSAAAATEGIKTPSAR